MSKPLKVLIVEDSEDDTLITVRELKRGGYEPTYQRVETAEATQEALRSQEWDVIIAGYTLPNFTALDALRLMKGRGLDLPFIIVTDIVRNDTAAMKSGAHGYIMKDNLERLVPAIERELREAEVPQQRKKAEDALRESEGKYR